MKKLFLSLGLMGLCLSLSAQGSLPYQKGESMISLRNPYFGSVRESNSGTRTGWEYGLELDYNRFIANNWSVGLGGSFREVKFGENVIGLGSRTLGMHISSRYYLPSISIKSTYLSFFGESWAGIDRSFSNSLTNDVAFRRTSFYGGLGAAYRPFRFFSVDFSVQRGWQKMVDQSTSLVISEGEAWNASLGFNFHLAPK
ncbi:MAG: hypothetical protein AAFN10_21045 [Bacteroidota bacterium]